MRSYLTSQTTDYWTKSYYLEDICKKSNGVTKLNLSKHSFLIANF